MGEGDMQQQKKSSLFVEQKAFGEYENGGADSHFDEDGRHKRTGMYIYGLVLCSVLGLQSFIHLTTLLFALIS